MARELGQRDGALLEFPQQAVHLEAHGRSPEQIHAHRIQDYGPEMKAADRAGPGPLANQIEREGPDDSRTAEWAAKVRSMNGLSKARHLDAYAGEPIETLDRPLEIVSTVTEFFAVVLRDITETRESFAPHTATIAGAVEMRSGNMHVTSWASIPDTMRVRLGAWNEEVQSIAHLARSRTQQTA